MRCITIDAFALVLALVSACQSTSASELPLEKPSFELVQYSRETTKQVDAYSDCDSQHPSMRENQHRYLWLHEYNDLVVECLDVGRAVAVVPGARLESGVEYPPTLVFAAAGSLWFLTPSLEDPDRYSLPAPHADLRRIGESIRLADDVDGDGVQDLIVEVYSRREERWLSHVFSTARRRLLHRLAGAENVSASCRVPDRDGDGVDDLAVLTKSTIEGEGKPRFASSVALYSVATGALLGGLAEHETPYLWSRDRIEFTPNGPGRRPALIVADGRLRAIEFESGNALWSREYEPERGGIVEDLMLFEDVNGDGDPDWLLAVGSGRMDTEVQLRSGRTGELLRVTRGLRSDTESGYCLALYIDLDGDGAQEVLSTNLPFGSSVVVLSGRDGSALLEINDPMNWSNGSFLDASVDWDGKGLPDLVIGEDVRTCGGSAQEVCIISMEDHCVLRSFTPASLTHYLVRD